MDEGDLIEKAFDRWTEKIDQKLVARKSFNGFWSFVPGWLIYRCEKRLKHRWIGSWHTLKNLQKWSNKAAVTAEIKMVRLWEGGGEELSATHTFLISVISVKFNHVGANLRWKLNVIQKLFAYLLTKNNLSHHYSFQEWRLQLCWTTQTPPSGWQVWVNLKT